MYRTFFATTALFVVFATATALGDEAVGIAENSNIIDGVVIKKKNQEPCIKEPAGGMSLLGVKADMGPQHNGVRDLRTSGKIKRPDGTEIEIKAPQWTTDVMNEYNSLHAKVDAVTAKYPNFNGMLWSYLTSETGYQMELQSLVNERRSVEQSIEKAKQEGRDDDAAALTSGALPDAIKNINDRVDEQNNFKLLEQRYVAEIAPFKARMAQLDAYANQMCQ